jgi:GTP cyclohydrolase I
MRGRFHPPPDVTSFPNTKRLDELYVVGPITVRSMCSHHLCPVVGRAWCGMVAGDRLIGLSKFSRLCEHVMARPQIQEEATAQLADAIAEACDNPPGLGVVVQASHSCMTWRGVRENETLMTTSVMRGALRDKPEARAEFLSLIGVRP